MKHTHLFILLISPFFVFAQSNWVELNSNTTEDLSQLHFVDEQIGHAVGTNGTLLRTLDGGLNWTSSQVGEQTLGDVYFIDENNGFIQSEGMIYRTENGLDFVAMQLLLDGIPQNDTINYELRTTKMNFNGSIGVISGTYSDWMPQTSPQISKHWKTLDFGATWVEITMPTHTTIEFLDAEHWCAAGVHVNETFDGGQSWELQPITFGFPPRTDDCFIISDSGDKGFASLLYHLDFLAFNPINWTMSNDANVHNVIDMDLEGETLYSLVFSSEGQYITESPDLGQTYLEETVALSEAWDLEFVGEGIGWACGEAGKIWKLDQSNSLPELGASSKVNIFPNPTSDFLKIQIEATWAPTNMEVYDASGRLVKSEKVAAQIDLRELSQGKYTLRVYDAMRVEEIAFVVVR